MRPDTVKGLHQFLFDYPGMSTAPPTIRGFKLCGKFSFKASILGENEIQDEYELEIIIPSEFPKAIPLVKETVGKIPTKAEFHVNSDRTLCLGSPLRLIQKMYTDQSLTGFTNRCLIPYLYAVSYKRKNGGDFILGELAHGVQGIIDDYSELLGLEKQQQIKQAITLLGMKKRIANKKPCPCGCGLRLGACPFHLKLNDFRKMASRSWFRSNH